MSNCIDKQIIFHLSFIVISVLLNLLWKVNLKTKLQLNGIIYKIFYGKYPYEIKKKLQINADLCKIMVLVIEGVIFEN
jgi:hypothetical protein